MSDGVEEVLELEVGRVYEAKRRQRSGFFWNDRQIVWLGISQVQYDSPVVKSGQGYPVVSLEAFKKWVGRDVTEESPDGEWRLAGVGG